MIQVDEDSAVTFSTDHFYTYDAFGNLIAEAETFNRDSHWFDGTYFVYDGGKEVLRFTEERLLAVRDFNSANGELLALDRPDFAFASPTDYTCAFD